MSRLTRLQATQLCETYLSSMLAANDVIDIRQRKINYQIYSCRIIDDSCILIVANNLEEVKQHIKNSVGGVEWQQADTSNWPAPHTRMTVLSGFYRNKVIGRIVLYKVPDNALLANSITVKEYVKKVLLNN